MAEYIAVLISIPLFMILFLPIRTALEHMPLFQGGRSWVMAAAVTSLCIIAMWTLVTPSPNTKQAEHDGDGLPFILIPYVALGLTILAVLLLRYGGVASWIRRFAKGATGSSPDAYYRQAKESRVRQPRRSASTSKGLIARLLDKPRHKGEQE